MNHGQIVAMGTSEDIIRDHGSGESLEIHGNQILVACIKANTEFLATYDKARREIFVPLRKKSDALATLAVAEQSDGERNQTRQASLDDVFVKLVSGIVNEQGEVTMEENGTKHTARVNRRR